MSLPIEWVEKIFRKLTLAYGRDFLARWEGITLADVKTDWMHELAGYENAPEAIAFALQNLPASRPPTVFEFREMCRKAPRKAEAQIEYKPDPARLAEELKKLNQSRKAPRQNVDCKAWAKALKARHEAGENLGQYQIFCYRKALKMDLIPEDPLLKRERQAA